MWAVPLASNSTLTCCCSPWSRSAWSLTCASAAIVHAPVVGLKVGPSAGSGPAGTKATYRTAAVTRIAAATLMKERIGGRRFGALAMRTAGCCSARGGAIVTDGSLSLCLLFGSFFLAAAGELGDHRRVGEGRGVAERPVLGHVAEQAPHDLARTGLGQLRREDDVGRGGELADHLSDVLPQLLEHRRRPLFAALERDEGDDRLPRLRIVAAGHRRLRDRRMADQRALDLDRRDAVSGDVHHIVDAAEQPEVAVLVDSGAVADEVDVLPTAPVGFLVALWIP